MPVPYADVTDEKIRSADVITAIDPQTGSARRVYGSVAASRPYPSGPYQINVLEVDLPNGDDAPFKEFCQRVKTLKYKQKDESARELAKKHYEVETGLTRIIRFSGSANVEAEPVEPIRLLEVNENTVPSGVVPLGFGPAPTAGIRFPSVIIEVTPDEYEKIRTRELKLPEDWEALQQEDLPRRPDAQGAQ